MYKVSSKFGMDIPFEELIENNKICKIEMDSQHHFETYEGVLIYVTHPNSKELFNVQLGVDEEGIMYEGDYGCKDEHKKIPIETGLKILMAYKEFIDKRNDLERLLVKNRLDKSMVKIKIE